MFPIKGFRCIAFAISILLAQQAAAWGRIGHDLACRVAARLAADNFGKDKPPERATFFKIQTVDLGFYCNVPDRVWKSSDYDAEWFNHFMDLEIFERAFKAARDENKLTKEDNPYSWDRVTFEAKFPEVTKKAGRSFWRIQELDKTLEATAKELQNKELPKEKRFDLQLQWLLTAGVMGHYVTDLSQPLHVSENYDGEMTGQKGVHSFFEDVLVDELWPTLDPMVMAEAQKLWKKDAATRQKRSTLELITDLAKVSSKTIPELLTIDKKNSRDKVKLAAKANQQLIVTCLARGAVAQAELMIRRMDWTPENNRFFNFSGKPAFIPTPK